MVGLVCLLWYVWFGRFAKYFQFIFSNSSLDWIAKMNQIRKWMQGTIIYISYTIQIQGKENHKIRAPPGCILNGGTVPLFYHFKYFFRHLKA